MLDFRCGEPRRPWDKSTTIERNVTCLVCKAKRRAFRKSAKARAALHGVA